MHIKYAEAENMWNYVDLNSSKTNKLLFRPEYIKNDEWAME